MGSRMPKLADVQCTRVEFQPGDRIIVKVFTDLDRDQRKKLLKTVAKWAGPDVEVLLVDLRKYDIEVVKNAPSKLSRRAARRSFTEGIPIGHEGL